MVAKNDFLDIELIIHHQKIRIVAGGYDAFFDAKVAGGGFGGHFDGVGFGDAEGDGTAQAVGEGGGASRKGAVLDPCHAVAYKNGLAAAYFLALDACICWLYYLGATRGLFLPDEQV